MFTLTLVGGWPASVTANARFGARRSEHRVSIAGGTRFFGDADERRWQQQAPLRVFPATNASNPTMPGASETMG